jgi:hypothetical protein
VRRAARGGRRGVPGHRESVTPTRCAASACSEIESPLQPRRVRRGAASVVSARSSRVRPSHGESASCPRSSASVLASRPLDTVCCFAVWRVRFWRHGVCTRVRRVRARARVRVAYMRARACVTTRDDACACAGARFERVTACDTESVCARASVAMCDCVPIRRCWRRRGCRGRPARRRCRRRTWRRSRRARPQSRWASLHMNTCQLFV